MALCLFLNRLVWPHALYPAQYCTLRRAVPRQIENGRVFFFFCLKSALNPHTSEKDVSQILSSPYDQLLSMLNWGVPPSIHTSLLPSRDTNVTFCTTLHLTPSPVSTLCNVDPQIAREIDTRTHAGKEWYLMLQRCDEHARDFYTPPPPRPNVKWTKESPQHTISGRGVRGSETPELDARSNEVDSVCD